MINNQFYIWRLFVWFSDIVFGIVDTRYSTYLQFPSEPSSYMIIFHSFFAVLHIGCRVLDAGCDVRGAGCDVRSDLNVLVGTIFYKWVGATHHGYSFGFDLAYNGYVCHYC